MNQVPGAVAKALDPPLLAWAYLASYCKGRENRRLFDGVETYCMFLGYPHSGHSLIGSLLDAHPNAIVAHELDALKFVRAGFGKHQLYELLLDNSRRFAQRRREWNGYGYEVPRQWQGRFNEVRVIGDKRAVTPPATGGGPGATAPVAKDRRHRCQVRPRRQEPLR